MADSMKWITRLASKHFKKYFGEIKLINSSRSFEILISQMSVFLQIYCIFALILV